MLCGALVVPAGWGHTVLRARWWLVVGCALVVITSVLLAALYCSGFGFHGAMVRGQAMVPW